MVQDWATRTGFAASARLGWQIAPKPTVQGRRQLAPPQLVLPVTGRSHSACDSICVLSDRRPADSYRLHPSGACPISSLENPDGRGRRQTRTRGPAIWPSGRPRGRPHVFPVPFPASTFSSTSSGSPTLATHLSQRRGDREPHRPLRFFWRKGSWPHRRAANFIVLALFSSSRQVGPTAGGYKFSNIKEKHHENVPGK